MTIALVHPFSVGVIEMAVAKSVKGGTSSKQVTVVLNWFQQNKLAFEDKCKQAVIKMMSFEPWERKLLCTGLKKIFERPCIVNRMLACAERGIPDAQYLYSTIMVVSHARIRRASTRALAQLADPNHVFHCVMKNGSVLQVASKDIGTIGFNQFKYVWEARLGEVSVPDQRAALAQSKSTAPAVAKSISYIISATAVSVGGVACVDFRNDDGTVTRRNLKEIRKYTMAKRIK